MLLRIANGTLVTAERSFAGDLLIDGESIAALESSPGRGPPADQTIDAAGCLIIPGGVDVHTHLDLPVGALTSSDDFETGTIAAAVGGTTSVIDYTNHSRGQTLNQYLDAWRTKAERAVVDYGFHATVAEATPAILAELAGLPDQGITSLKVFLAYPGRLLLDDAEIMRVMLRAQELGLLVCVHAEAGPPLEPLIQLALARHQTAPIHHALTRPEAAEGTGTERALALAELAGAPVYIVHISCARALARLVEARQRGQLAWGETCPQYLTLDQSALAGTRDDPWAGARYVCTPPLRSADNQAPLWQALADGELQVVATDHCPFNDADRRAAADFAGIPNGLPGIETRLTLLFDGVRRGRLSPERWVEVCCTTPAQLFGLAPRKGHLVTGADADVVIWDPARPVSLSRGDLHMRVDHSIYEGRTMTGGARTVLSRGEVIVDDGIFCGRPGRGQYLHREAGPLTRSPSAQALLAPAQRIC